MAAILVFKCTEGAGAPAPKKIWHSCKMAHDEDVAQNVDLDDLTEK